MSAGDKDPRATLRALFDEAVAAALPERCLPPYLPQPPEGRTIVVGAGKAASAMARAVEAHWPETAPLEGLVATRHGQRLPTRRIEIVESSHPVPDRASEDAARRMLARVQGLAPDDLVLCLVSGGASALLALPAPGLTLADKQQVNKALLASGASIHEMNCVRKHLSAIKGGRLAAASVPAAMLTLAISDVPGDDPSVIGSGPTVADPTRFADARAILAKYRIAPAPAVAHCLAQGPEAETPKPGDPRLSRARYALIATPMKSLEAAATRARALGLEPRILGDAIEGEARAVALEMAHIARDVAREIEKSARAAPIVLLSGGEATVTVRGKGKGGRNSEFLLALALALEGEPRIAALACGTDGIDGTEENAGAIVLPDTLARANRLGLDPRALLADNDAYSFFQALGDLVVTGPTQTNVDDFRALLVDPKLIDGARSSG
ncbi:MAG TPA: glycerate kinase [Alphaproteobacteria bacterium]|nr:glycerate kinase [Alphaproteobacteria bacterium]